jgi:hypothetical protein
LRTLRLAATSRKVNALGTDRSAKEFGVGRGMTSPTDPQVIAYQTVAARRLQWDNLLWQVAILSLTAQAFLFSIALGPDSSPFARISASVLAIAVTFLCVTLMARHRQAEVVDAHWLRKFEEEHQLPRVHGEPWRKARANTPPTVGWLRRAVPLLPGYATWVLGLTLFGLIGVVIVFLTLLWPSALAGPQ